MSPLESSVMMATQTMVIDVAHHVNEKQHILYVVDCHLMHKPILQRELIRHVATQTEAIVLVGVQLHHDIYSIPNLVHEVVILYVVAYIIGIDLLVYTPRHHMLELVNDDELAMISHIQLPWIVDKIAT